MASAFSHIQPTANGHYRLNLHAAVYYLVDGLRRLGAEAGVPFEKTVESHRFLNAYLKEIIPTLPDGRDWDEILLWWRAEIHDWEETVPAALPLAVLSRGGQLGFTARIGLMIIALCDEDSRFCGLFEELQSPLRGRRPTMELIARILRAPLDCEGGDGWSACRELLGAGLVEPVNADAPRAEWMLRTPEAVWRMIRGEATGDLLPGCQLLAADSFPSIDQLNLDDDLRRRLTRLPPLMESGELRTLILRSMPGGDQLQALGAVARALGRGLAVIPWTATSGEAHGAQRIGPASLGPICRMSPFLPVFVCDLAPGETIERPTTLGYDGPIGFALGLEGGFAGTTAALTLNMPELSLEQRRRCWRESLHNHVGPDIEALSEGFLLPAGHIRRAAAMAVGQAAADGRSTVGFADVREACRSLNRQTLDQYAERMGSTSAWRDLVASPLTAAALQDLERRCRCRERLQTQLGKAFARNFNRGVRALFSGPSGTGKTLAAMILAAELDMDLYRVDLGAVVNKYVGETEKNLHQLLSRAEALDVILLLDEGDSLLGARTDVKSANDRYANLETNYLLQRLESYQGVVIVTTNAAKNIDSAFQRRMDAVVGFIHPQAAERREIWRLHLPASHALDEAFLAQVVQRCALTGGQIRNAALHAAVLALDEGAGPLRRLHLEAALRAEYRKAGAAYPLESLGAAAVPRGVAAFLEVLRL